jgi:LPXTG-motif cell wall-anchored protein
MAATGGVRLTRRGLRPDIKGHKMARHKTKLSGVLVLIAGAMLCFPQAANARAARAGPQVAATISPTTTVPVMLIPPLVIHPSASSPVRPARAADPAPRLAGHALPSTGPSHVLAMSLVGLCLIGLGVLLRRLAVG